MEFQTEEMQEFVRGIAWFAEGWELKVCCSGHTSVGKKNKKKKQVSVLQIGQLIP